jgi:hypothetical protein
VFFKRENFQNLGQKRKWALWMRHLGTNRLDNFRTAFTVQTCLEKSGSISGLESESLFKTARKPKAIHFFKTIVGRNMVLDSIWEQDHLVIRPIYFFFQMFLVFGSPWSLAIYILCHFLTFSLFFKSPNHQELSKFDIW